ncbi:MAG: transglycosylase SLT domain-containing protein [Bacteroidales bacterium]|jgi:membrane-bound lytic murein transglycosylase D|nr:transglycosylase SLT domain-containing protein [Bacteroidales bacterium]
MKNKLISFFVSLFISIQLFSNPDSIFVKVPNDVFNNFPESTNILNQLNYYQISADSIVNDSTLTEYDVFELLDNLLNELINARINFSTDVEKLNIYNFEQNYIPVWSDSVYIERMQCINLQTPIELVYNKEVQNYINAYAVKRRATTSKMLGLAEVYFPIFEEALDRHGLPLELKYLPVVESALNPIAGSRAGAKGLWQFMYGTGKLYGLKQTSYVDDRFDPYKSTEAACQHLKDLYNIYDDWLLALAAYNSGVGNVNKAIRRAGGKKNYWLIWPYLPRETRGYVPAFSAVVYIMNYNIEHNIYPTEPTLLAYETDTVMINEVLSFEQINEIVGTPIETIRFLNPTYKMDIIPATQQQAYSLKLPIKDLLDFLSNEEIVFAHKTESGKYKEKMQAEIKRASEANVHIVRQGESLSVIAKKYHTSVGKIKDWNKLKSDNLKIGQKLVIYPG